MNNTPASWIGRRLLQADTASQAPLERLAALLDHEAGHWPAEKVPPLGHWLYFLPKDRQSELDIDGHAKRGAFLPPSLHSRRMWAGGRCEFLAAIPAGSPITRRSEIIDIETKQRAPGDMLLVKVEHKLFAGDDLAVLERQDIVYLDPAETEVAKKYKKNESEPRAASRSRHHTVDAVQLFRYSALTYNSHRIHYDLPFAKKNEGYPALVVHGPYAATLLMDFLLQEFKDLTVTHFEFRAIRPLFCNQRFALCLNVAEPNFRLWITDCNGDKAMTATVKAR